MKKICETERACALRFVTLGLEISFVMLRPYQVSHS